LAAALARKIEATGACILLPALVGAWDGAPGDSPRRIHGCQVKALPEAPLRSS
jgi:hypothetical protein